jgi:membrane protein implicated in regulation of membrane protease activity
MFKIRNLIIQYFIVRINIGLDIVIPKFSNIILSIAFFLPSIGIIAFYLFALMKKTAFIDPDGNFKTFVIAMVTQIAPVWELLKIVNLPEDLIKEYANSVYIVTVLLHSAIDQICPNSFEKLKKFNFGFTVQYLILYILNIYISNIQINPIIPCIISGIIAAYLQLLSIRFMAITTYYAFISHYLFIVLVACVVILSPSKDEATVLFDLIIAGTITLLIYLVAVILQLRRVNSGVEGSYCEVNQSDDIEEGRAITTQVNKTINDNYSTFTN